MSKLKLSDKTQKLLELWDRVREVNRKYMQEELYPSQDDTSLLNNADELARLTYRATRWLLICYDKNKDGFTRLGKPYEIPYDAFENHCNKFIANPIEHLIPLVDFCIEMWVDGPEILSAGNEPGVSDGEVVFFSVFANDLGVECDTFLTDHPNYRWIPYLNLPKCINYDADPERKIVVAIDKEDDTVAAYTFMTEQEYTFAEKTLIEILPAYEIKAMTLEEFSKLEWYPVQGLMEVMVKCTPLLMRRKAYNDFKFESWRNSWVTF